MTWRIELPVCLSNRLNGSDLNLSFDVPHRDPDNKIYSLQFHYRNRGEKAASKRTPWFSWVTLLTPSCRLTSPPANKPHPLPPFRSTRVHGWPRAPQPRAALRYPAPSGFRALRPAATPAHAPGRHPAPAATGGHAAASSAPTHDVRHAAAPWAAPALSAAPAANVIYTTKLCYFTPVRALSAPSHMLGSVTSSPIGTLLNSLDLTYTHTRYVTFDSFNNNETRDEISGGCTTGDGPPAAWSISPRAHKLGEEVLFVQDLTVPQLILQQKNNGSSRKVRAEDQLRSGQIRTACRSGSDRTAAHPAEENEVISRKCQPPGLSNTRLQDYVGELFTGMQLINPHVRPPPTPTTITTSAYPPPYAPPAAFSPLHSAPPLTPPLRPPAPSK